MKKLLLLIITIAFVSPVMCQDTKEDKRSRREQRKLRISAIAKQEEEGVIKYKKHTAFGIKLTTDGYGAFVEVARAQSVKRALLFQLDIAERKHKKEEKVSRIEDIYGTSNPLIQGKQNFVYPVKLGVQQQFLLGNKGNRSGVGITANAGGGFAAAILRPYLVEVDANGVRQYEHYYNPDSTDNIASHSIPLGGPSFGTGWDKLKLNPGLYAKIGVRFDFGKYNEMLSAIEIGISEEYYFKKVAQMIWNGRKDVFFNAYITIMFGKRK